MTRQDEDSKFISSLKNFRLIATGDNNGNILFWRLNETLNQDRPYRALNYQGRVLDLKFIQNHADHIKEYKVGKGAINCLLSLHSNPNQLIVTCLYNFEMTQVIPLPFVAHSIVIVNHSYDGYQVYLMSASSWYGQAEMIRIDLSFKRHQFVDEQKDQNNQEDETKVQRNKQASGCKVHKHQDTMRDQNLKTLSQVFAEPEDDEDQEELNEDSLAIKNIIDIWCTHERRGMIDPLNSINLLMLCTRQQHFICLDYLCHSEYVENLMDSNQNYASHNLSQMNNRHGLDILFHHCLSNQTLDFD